MAVSSQRQRLIIVEVKQKKGEGYFRLTLPEPVARKVLCWHINSGDHTRGRQLR